jgi:hypothetical protein
MKYSVSIFCFLRPMPSEPNANARRAVGSRSKKRSHYWRPANENKGVTFRRQSVLEERDPASQARGRDGRLEKTNPISGSSGAATSETGFCHE